MNVTACLVTRGNVDMQGILDSLPRAWEVVVWDNSVEADVAVYGRYAAIQRAQTEAIYVQDDDCVLAPASLISLESSYQEHSISANMPLPFREHYSDSCLVGFGALFHRDLPALAFEKVDVETDLFYRVCDVFFTTLTPFRVGDLAYRNLPWATDDSRMYRQPWHVAERAAALALARKVRDGH